MASSQQAIPFELTTLLASGSQGSVFLGARLDGETPRDVAIKRIQLSMEIEVQLKEIAKLQEGVAGLTQLVHPNIIRHFGGQLNVSPSLIQPAAYDIIMEFAAGGRLEDAVKKDIPLVILQRWIRDILEGLAYIHGKVIIHRDINCTNIVLSHVDPEQASLKIADLGNFKQLLGTSSIGQDVTHTQGTILFMSPEMIQAYSTSVHIGRRTDIWSVGCTIIQMVTGKCPEFAVENNGQRIIIDGTKKAAIMKHVGCGNLPEIPTGIPSELDELIRACLTVDQTIRPTASKLLQYAFFAADYSQATLPRKMSQERDLDSAQPDRSVKRDIL